MLLPSPKLNACTFFVLQPDLIMHILMQGYQAVYARLGVRLEERGESCYNPMLPSLVQWLMEHNIAEESEGAKVVFVKVTFCSHCTGCLNLSAQSLKMRT